MTTDPTDALVTLGWDERVAALFATASTGDASAVPGRVVRVDRGAANVVTATGPVRASFAAGLRDAAPEDLPAVGDWVVLTAEPGAPASELAVVLPRRSAFVRGDPRREGGGQVVAANVDTVFLVHAFGRDANLRRLERELVLAWESGAVPVVVLNKADLVADPEPVVADVERIAGGVDVHAVSCVDGRGLDALRRSTQGHRTVALIGPSGVGKSTLVNRFLGSDVQETAAVRAGDQRGRHTTTARELLVLPAGGLLLDTPGLRSVAMFDADEGLERAFADVEACALECRFRDCRHEGEPDCAVAAAVADGRLDPERLAHYRTLRAELERAAESRADGIVKAERRARDRALGRLYRATPKRHR